MVAIGRLPSHLPVWCPGRLPKRGFSRVALPSLAEIMLRGVGKSKVR
jgi:hypothetical protein